MDQLPVPRSDRGAGTPVTITAGDGTITATINDSDASKDLLATLPTTLTWNRKAGIEYITELAAPLTETGPFYTDVRAGDIVYYNPLDSITIIYAPTSSVPTLTKMGQITSDLDDFENLRQRRYANRASAVHRRHRLSATDSAPSSRDYHPARLPRSVSTSGSAPRLWLAPTEPS